MEKKEKEAIELANMRLKNMSELDQQIFRIAIDIYQCAIYVINFSKKDDDAFFKTAYLKTANGSIIYEPFGEDKFDLSFEEKGKLDPRYIEIELRPVILEGFEPKIGIMPGRIKISYLIPSKGIYFNYDLDINKKNENKLSQDQLNYLKEYLEELTKQIPTIEYDTASTHSYSNLTNPYKSIYQKEMYEAEMKKAKEEDPEAIMIPSVKTAVEWWLDNIRLIDFGSEDDDDIGTKQLSDEQKSIFKKDLSEIITSHLRQKGEADLVTDYVPYGILLEAMEKAGIDLSFPNYVGPRKTNMTVRNDSVSIYGTVLYESKSSEDVLKRIRGKNN